MKKLLSLILAVALVVTCMAGVVFAADPIAEVTNGDKVQKAYDAQDIIDMVQENGKTKVKILTDVTLEKELSVPYTAEFDLNGHTMKSNGGNCLAFFKAGTENQHTVVKNGTLIGGTAMGLHLKYGSLELRNVTAVAPKSIAVGIYEPDAKYNANNIIDGCTLIAGGTSGTFGWNASTSSTAPPNTDQVGLDIIIQNSTLIQFTEGNVVFGTRNTGGSFMTLGENVTVYVNEWTESFVKESLTLKGKALQKVEGSFTYEYNGNKYIELAKYVTTPAAGDKLESGSSTPAQPETPAVKGEAANSQQLVDALKEGGNVKLTANIALADKASIAADKTVTLDLNGFTITSDDGATKYIENAGNLTVTGKTGGITVTGGSGSVRCIYNTGNLTIQGGNYSVTVASKGGYTIYNKAAADKSLVINGGTFRIEQTGATAANTVDVFGLGGDGTVSISGSVKAEAVNQSENPGAGANVMYLFNSAKTKITVNGGSFTVTSAAGNGSAVRYPKTAGTSAITLAGGEFVVNNMVCDGPVQGTLTVAGGKFAADVKEYLGDGYEQKADGTVAAKGAAAPATPSVPTTNVPDVNVPKTGASVMALGVMALVSLAGAVITKKN